MDNKSRNNGGQVDLLYLFRIIKTNIVSILVVAILCGGAAGVFRYMTKEPTYTSKVSFFVNGVATNSQGEIFVTGSGASTARYLTETFSEIMKQNVILTAVQERVKENAGIVMDTKQIAGMVGVNYEAQLMDVSITHVDAEVAYQVAKAFEEVAPTWFNELMNLRASEDMPDEETVASATANLVKPTNVAVKSANPSGRGVTFMAALGAFVGAAVVFVVCYVRALQDNTVYTDAQLRDMFSIPVVGQIPTWDTDQTAKKAKSKKRRRGMLAKKRRLAEVSVREYNGRLLATDTPFAISEAFKVLRTNMCYTSKGDDCAVYGVTSAFVGAGKSLVTANAAISFAQMGKRVLLIDGDMRCPVQQQIFGLPSHSQGLSEFLAGVQKDVNAVISSTAYEGLSVITAGHQPPNPAELLASNNMKRLIEYAKEQYDVVFVDLPPVGVVTDAGVIGDLMTGYALVVRSSYSDRREIELCVQTMESLGASLAGFILNDVDLKGSDEYGGHYYGSYGAYSHYGKQMISASHASSEKKSRRSKNADA